MPKKKLFIKLALLTLLTTTSFSDTSTLDMSTCISCHGKHFEKSAIKTSKIVKDLTKEEIYKALIGYKKESKGGAMQSVMMQQMKRFSEEDIEQLAQNIVDQNITIVEHNQTENNVSIESNLLEVDTSSCMRCHGENFEKSAMGISRVVNTLSKIEIENILFNYKYNSISNNMNALMSWQTAKLSDEEIKAIAQQIGQ